MAGAHVGARRAGRSRRASGRLAQLAADERDHGAQAQRLLDHGVACTRPRRPPPPRAGGRHRVGWRNSRSKAQASAVAVVSWPASSRVISWSRSSASSIPLAVLIARRDQHREDVVALGEVGSARRAAISAASSSSVRASSRSNSRTSRCRARTSRTPHAGDHQARSPARRATGPGARTWRSRSRSRSKRGLLG